jgi:hypothetical protein
MSEPIIADDPALAYTSTSAEISLAIGAKRLSGTSGT